MITTKKVYNKKYKEIRVEFYVDDVFYTDKKIAFDVENTENLPLQ